MRPDESPERDVQETSVTFSFYRDLNILKRNVNKKMFPPNFCNF